MWHAKFVEGGGVRDSFTINPKTILRKRTSIGFLFFKRKHMSVVSIALKPSDDEITALPTEPLELPCTT